MLQSYSWLDSRLLIKFSRSSSFDSIIVVVVAVTDGYCVRFTNFNLCTPSVKPDSVNLKKKLNVNYCKKKEYNTYASFS